MPHAGLMNERLMGVVEGPLQRARLHVRGGRRRIRQGKISAGIATFADALSAALEWQSALAGGLPQHPSDDRSLYRELVRSGRVSGQFDYDAFDRLTERALNNELETFDPAETVAGFEALMIEMGVMPFDESMLPPEDPKTY